jgi:hypothetical protein
LPDLVVEKPEPDTIAEEDGERGGKIGEGKRIDGERAA